MRAIRVDSHGGPEVLKLAELDEPAPGPGELLVRVEAAGLNFIDVYHRTGLYPNPLPFTPGLEGAGVVVDVGKEVAVFRAGGRVAWTGVATPRYWRHWLWRWGLFRCGRGPSSSRWCSKYSGGVWPRCRSWRSLPVGTGAGGSFSGSLLGSVG